MLKLFLWLRYLRKKKIVFLSITAIGLSTAVLMVVASLFGGFIKVFEQSAVEVIGDVVLSPPMRFVKCELLIKRLEGTAVVEAATATLMTKGLLHLGNGNVRAVDIWGIESVGQARVTGFKRSLIKQGKAAQDPSFEVAGFPERTGGYVGIGVIAEPDEETDEYDFGEIERMIGQEVVLTTGAMSEDRRQRTEDRRQENLTSDFKSRTVRFTISDIVFTGVYDFDKSFVYLPIEQLQRILYAEEYAQIADQIQIKLKPDVQTEVALAEIRGVWQGFAREELEWTASLIEQTTIVTARQMQSEYVAELRKQMGVQLVIFGVVSLSVVLLILCIFYMIVMTKQRDIAIIKSCGAASNSVAWIFAGFGICNGVIGSAIGIILGCVITKNINTIEEWIRIIFGLKLWKSSVYMFSKIPNEVDWECVLPIVLSAIAAAGLGALIPAIVAAWTRPVEILRYE